MQEYIQYARNNKKEPIATFVANLDDNDEVCVGYSSKSHKEKCSNKKVGKAIAMSRAKKFKTKDTLYNVNLPFYIKYHTGMFVKFLKQCKRQICNNI